MDALSTLLKSKPYQLCEDAPPEVMKAKNSGFKTSIVTTIARFKFDEAIKPTRRYFDFVMTGYEAEFDKSHPKMYQKALEMLDMKPEETVMIGDDVQLDVLLPESIGIKAILLDRSTRKATCENRLVDAYACSLNDAIETVISQFGES
jgi:FMN phosphatase YigB (HAD superfamily)